MNVPNADAIIILAKVAVKSLTLGVAVGGFFIGMVYAGKITGKKEAK